MSIKQIDALVCDVTGDVYEGQPEWMTLTHAASGQQFDFRDFACLEQWVNSEDSDEPTVEEFNSADAPEVPEEIQVAAQATEPVVDTTAPAPRPAMTLMDAMMLGQKPGFDPTIQQARDDATRGRG